MRTDAFASSYSARSRVRPPLPAAPARVHRRGPAGAGFIARAGCAGRRAPAAPRHRVAPASRRATFGRAGLADDSRRSVQAGEVSPWRLLEPNYIAALLASDAHRRPDRRAARSGTRPARRTSLLQTLLRHALLREIADAAARIAARAPGADVAAAAARRGADRPRHRRAARRRRGRASSTCGGRRSPATARSVEYLEGADERSTRGAGSRRSAISARSLADLQGLRQRDAAIPDAGHAGSLVASARCLDHLVRDQAARGDAAQHANGPARRRPTAGSRTCRPTPAARAAPVHAAGRRSRSARRASQRQRLHPRAVDDACRGRGAAAQRASRCHRRRREPTARSRSTCRRAACARRRGCSTGVRQGQPLGALLGYRFERSLHDLGARSLHRAAARARAACGARELDSTALRRSSRSPPTTSSTGWSLQRRCGATAQTRGRRGALQP